MKPNRIIFISVVVLLACGLFFPLTKHFKLLQLTSTELAARTPKPPAPIEQLADCNRTQRAIAELILSEPKIVAVKNAGALSADELAIYRMVLKQWLGNDDRPVNVSNQTNPLDLTLVSEAFADCTCGIGIPVESFLQVAHSFHSLTQGDLLDGRVRLVDAHDQMDIVSASDPDKTMRKGHTVSDAVNNAFAKGFLAITEIAFDREHHRALVSYSFVCGKLCRRGATLLMEKINGEWKTQRECGGWIS